MKWFSIGLAILFSLLPLPGWVGWLRPDFVALLIIYWVMVTPDRFGLRTAWFLGILVDIIQGNLLGLHALSFSLMAYLVLKFNQRLRLFHWVQQAIVVLLLLGMQELIIIWIEGMLGHPPQEIGYLFSLLTSMIAWPGLCLFMQEITRKPAFR